MKNVVTVMYYDDLFGVFSSEEEAKNTIDEYIDSLPKRAASHSEFEIIERKLNTVADYYIKKMIRSWIPVEKYET